MQKNESNFGATTEIELGACCSNFSVELLGGIPCVEYADGQVSLEVNGGTPPFDYEWSSGATHTESQTISSDDDQISVTITDASGCMTMGSFDIPDLNSLDAVIESTPVISALPDVGSATVSIESGIPPFVYNWSNGATTPVIDNLTQGSYTVTITDAGGCSFEITTSVDEILGPALSIISKTDVDCFGNSTGSATVTTTNGVPPYSYSWSTGSSENMVDNLIAGSYMVTVSDFYGFMDVLEVVIDEPPILGLMLDEISPERNGNMDGAISISPEGGTEMGYTFEWYYMGSIISNEEDITGLSAGEYTLIITDSNGCTYSETFVVDMVTSTIDFESENQILLKPNPTTGVINISVSFPSIKEVDIALFNTSGRQIGPILSERVSNKDFLYDLSAFPAGVYIAQIRIENSINFRNFVLIK